MAASSAQAALPEFAGANGEDLRTIEGFFASAWRGSGVASDAFGIPRDRYEVTITPIADAPAPTLDHRISFEHGVVNAYRWELLPSKRGLVAARDLVSGELAKGLVNTHGFQWAFLGRFRTPFGVQRCRNEVVIKLISAVDIQANITVSFLGVTVGTATSHMRRV